MAGWQFEHHLILRSRAQHGVSKDGQQHDRLSSFETRPSAAPQGEARS